MRIAGERVPVVLPHLGALPSQPAASAATIHGAWRERDLAHHM